MEVVETPEDLGCLGRGVPLVRGRVVDDEETDVFLVQRAFRRPVDGPLLTCSDARSCQRQTRLSEPDSGTEELTAA